MALDKKDENIKMRNIVSVKHCLKKTKKQKWERLRSLERYCVSELVWHGSHSQPEISTLPCPSIRPLIASTQCHLR